MAYRDLGALIHAEYARPSPENGGQEAYKRGHKIDNRDVIPYNAYLLQKYQCHINVEKVCSVKALRYIFKYIFKGVDMATYRKATNRKEGDEPGEEQIADVEEGKYLSSGEAMWELLGFHRHGNWPPVFKLDIHLAGQNCITIDPETGLETVNVGRHTSLTAFYELNQSNPAARNILYREICKYYKLVGHTSEGKKWVPRVRGSEDHGVSGTKKVSMLGRIPFIGPNHHSKTEAFALYLLLCNVPGPTCEDDLKVVNGHTFSTLVEAAVARNLMESDNFINLAFDEAKQHCTGRQLRKFFASLCEFWQGVDFRKFWDERFTDLCEDILTHARQRNPGVFLNQAMIDQCLGEIGIFLNEMGSSLALKNLPEPSDQRLRFERQLCPSIILTQQQLDARYNSLNAQQQSVFDEIFEAVRNKSGGLFFINASGGTGKSYLLNTLITAICSNGLKVCPTASSGIASTILTGGTTLHSAFNVPLKVFENTVCNINKKTQLAEQVQKLDCVIWDEAPMQSRLILETLDRTFGDLRLQPDVPEKPSGGVVMVLSGDWKQTLPISKMAPDLLLFQ